jgi:hypothetical protein
VTFTFNKDESGGKIMNQHLYTIIIIGALILFSIYRRVRKSIGWQQINQGKMMFRMALSFIVGILFLVEGGFHPTNIISDVVGILIGVIIAYYSSLKTDFEQRDGHWYFRPNKWYGGVVIALFFGRFVYRFYEMYTQGAFSGANGGQKEGFQNFGAAVGPSWTTGLILIMFAYYIVYYIALLGKQKKFRPIKNDFN